MVQINFGQREVSCKVVFYGPGMSGKTTNLEIIHKKAPKDAVGEMVSIATETDRTLYFDFLPLDLGQVAGMRTKFQLYTVPGQIYYNATRKLVLQGVDGVIFVADSAPDKMPENLESLQNLRDNLAEMNLTLEDVPLVLQYNKRDLPTVMSIEDMNAQLNPMGVPVHEGVAREGKGVFATLKEISRLVIEKLNKEHAPAANRRRTNTAMTPSGAAPLPSAGTMTPARPMPAQAPAQAVARPMPTAAPQQPRVRAPQAAPMPARAPMPAQPTPSRGLPQLPPSQMPPPPDPRDKHLTKASPPSLENARQKTGGKVNLGATDPTLKRFKEASRPSGSGVKTLLIILIGLILMVILAVTAVIFVPAVRAMLPQDVQRMLMGGQQPAAQNPPATTTPATTTPAETTPAPDTPADTTPPTETTPSGTAPDASETTATPATTPADTAPAAEKPAEGSNGQ